MQSLSWENLFSIFKTLVPLKMAFFTNVIDLQAPLSACLTVLEWETKPFSRYLSRGNEKLLESRTVSQLIMPVHEPKVAYKLVQFCWKNPREYFDTLVYNQFYIT